MKRPDVIKTLRPFLSESHPNKGLKKSFDIDIAEKMSPSMKPEALRSAANMGRMGWIIPKPKVVTNDANKRIPISDDKSI